MASIGLTNGYYTVPVAPEHRKYLRFMWGGKLFQYTCLLNGLSSAPRYFTKLLKPVYGILHSQGHLNVGYIDDSYLQDSSFSDRSQNIQATICLFENLGFVINKEKLVLQPCQKLVLLGFILDSILMRVYLTPDKTGRVLAACQMLLCGNYVSIREVAQVIGLLVSSLPAVHYGPPFYRNLEIDENEALHKNRGNFEALMQNLGKILVGG